MGSFSWPGEGSKGARKREEGRGGFEGRRLIFEQCDSCEEGYYYAEGYSACEEDSRGLGWIGLSGYLDG